MRKQLALLSLMTLIGACVSGPEYRTDYDRSADFASYQTYGFFDDLGTDRAGYSSLITDHFKRSIRREMDALGYRYTEQGDADLLVNFAANAREVTDVRTRTTPTTSYYASYGYYGYRRGLYAAFPTYDREVETVRYKEGTANVDLVDVRANRLIWEGVVEGRLSEKAMANPGATIDRIVAEIFDRHPLSPAG